MMRRLMLCALWTVALAWWVSPIERAAPRAVAAVAADTADSLPPLPDSVMSATGWVQVHYIHHPYFACGMVLAVGCYTYDSGVMQVATGQSREQQWRTLLHEEVHMALYDAGFTALQRGERPWVDDSLAEIIADLRFRQGLAQGVH